MPHCIQAAAFLLASEAPSDVAALHGLAVELAVELAIYLQRVVPLQQVVM